VAKCIGARFELDAAAYFNGVGTTHPSGQAHSPFYADAPSVSCK
jgi:hypothetical protein